MPRPVPTTYPFVPKSTARLQAGQYWTIPLEDDRYAVGVVIGVPTKDTAPHFAVSSRIFTAGLLDLSAREVPTPEQIAGRRLLDWGYAHVKTIELTSAGAGLLGAVTPAFNLVRAVSHRAGGTVGLYENGTIVRPATFDECKAIPIASAWGLTFIRALARHHLGSPA